MDDILPMQEGHALCDVQRGSQDQVDVWDAAAWASQLPLLPKPALVYSLLQVAAQSGLRLGPEKQRTDYFERHPAAYCPHLQKIDEGADARHSDAAA